MAIDITLDTIVSGYQTTKINANFQLIETALNEAFSRLGTSPNAVMTDIDLDGNDVLNGGTGSFDTIILGGSEILAGDISQVGPEGPPGPQGPQGATGAGTGDLLAAQNLSDVDSVAIAFENIKQPATDEFAGVSEYATSAETIAGSSSTRSVTPAGLAAALAAFTVIPLGAVLDYTGPTAPTGFIFPYGQAVSRTTYALYFALVGTTYGVGNGTTTFNLPDLRGRVIAGKDDMGGSSANRLTGITGSVDGDVLGGAGGEQAHVLTIAELAIHNHGMSIAAGSYFGANNGGAKAAWSAGDSYAGTGTFTGGTGSIGSDSAHNTVQPTFILNKILYVGV